MKGNNLTRLLKILMVILILFGVSYLSAATLVTQQTELEIYTIRSGLAQIIVDVKNVGNETAEDTVVIIEVRGGILGMIDVLHVCGGCGNCSNLLEPGMVKTESTLHSKIIFGIGAVKITTQANATNAARVQKNATGFILGPIIIIN